MQNKPEDSARTAHAPRTLSRRSAKGGGGGAEATDESACATWATPLPAGGCACATPRVRDGGRQTEAEVVTRPLGAAAAEAVAALPPVGSSGHRGPLRAGDWPHRSFCTLS
jgi:hypothetical protein